MGLALVGGAKPQALADEVRAVAPARGLMLDVGSKHTVSYFTAEDGRCNLTVVVGEKFDENASTNGSIGARMRFAIDQGKSAVIETAEGKSLQFSCASDASAMSVKTLDVVAYSAPRS
jgi:hypothetical protein